MPEDTIAAIATAAGGGVGIIRMSGVDAISLLEKHFRVRVLEPRVLTYGVFHDGGNELDDGMAVVMPGPKTFTGEDVGELHLHGGPLHLRRCLEVLLRSGARIAEPGEFSKRAFMNGKLDLTRAEAIADLIAAKTDRALAQARQHLRGAMWDRAMAARETLLQLRAELEANIDFVTEDIPPFAPEAMAARADALAASLEALAATYARGRLMREGARVVLVGSPNAGKSSLFNALLAQDRAIVTPIAGTTRDTLEESIDIAGVPVVLVDTAGLRATDDVVEALGVQRTHDAMGAADLVVRLVPPDEDAAGDGLIVYSKADVRRRVGLSVSVATGEGLDALRQAIAQSLGVDHQDELVLGRERQRAAVADAAAALRRAAEGLRAGLPPELPAVDLQDAMDALGQLVGISTIEDVLDRLFSTFCIGK